MPQLLQSAALTAARFSRRDQREVIPLAPESINFLEYWEERNGKTRHFTWITDFTVSTDFYRNLRQCRATVSQNRTIMRNIDHAMRSQQVYRFQ